MGKSFDNSAPVRVIPATKIGHPATGAIWVKVNGVTKQNGDLKDMILECRGQHRLPVHTDQRCKPVI